MSSHPETSPTNLTWQEVIIFSLSKCMVGRKIHTLNRGQAIECKLSLSAWIPLLNQNPNKVLSPLQATLWIAKALTIKRIFLVFVFCVFNMWQQSYLHYLMIHAVSFPPEFCGTLHCGQVLIRLIFWPGISILSQFKLMNPLGEKIMYL